MRFSGVAGLLDSRSSRGDRCTGLRRVPDIFITEDFLLQNDRAVGLYHRFARDLPILDYHCHLPPAQIAEDRRFDNLGQIWLAGDHYKWRAMRAAGVAERFCSGDASDWEKFEKWAATVPQALRSPLYHWTHLELKRPLGISDRLLSPKTAEGIWHDSKAKLARPEYSARGIMRQMNVVAVCTTDDPVDTLEHHQAIAADESFTIRVLPTFRPERATGIESPAAFNEWVDWLAERSGVDVGDDYDRFLDALRQRHDFFHRMGCRLSDHSVDTFYADDHAPKEVAASFRKLRAGKDLDRSAAGQFKSAVMYELAVMNAEKGWVQQLHFGVVRNNSSRMLRLFGPDAGCDSMVDEKVGRRMSRFFDRLDLAGKLAKTILYNLNPAHNELTVTMLGNFQDGSVPGKMQYGSGWWFLDQKDGIEKQLNSLSNQGLLSRFVGMLTDSRSFLSYTRHEYFRRILCNVLGTEMVQGLLPDDMELIGSMVRDICYGNAAEYFGFDVPKLEELGF